jgi:transcriptional regulator with XRE-family HTH domain
MTADAVAVQFGRNLAEAREWAGLSQRQLAARVSLRGMEISQLECGVRPPRLDKVALLADALGVQFRDLLFEIE